MVLQRHWPDVLKALLEAGADELDVSRKLPGERRLEDGEMVYLGVRRPLIEWALRDACLREGAVVVVPSVQINGLVGDPGSPPRVTGVSTADGRQFRGDVVIDALGRTSPSPSWLRSLGAAPVPVDSSECGLVY